MAKPRNQYVWIVRTDDGDKRQVRAHLFGSKWSLSSRLKGEEQWTPHTPPLLEDLIELEKLLFNKYQRKHTAWEHVVGVRELVAARSPRV